MTCIKTGARVYFYGYGTVCPADIYQVADAIIIRTNCSAEMGFSTEVFKPTHRVNLHPGCFSRDDLGIYVVSKYSLVEL